MNSGICSRISAPFALWTCGCWRCDNEGRFELAWSTYFGIEASGANVEKVLNTASPSPSLFSWRGESTGEGCSWVPLITLNDIDLVVFLKSAVCESSLVIALTRTFA